MRVGQSPSASTNSDAVSQNRAVPKFQFNGPMSPNLHNSRRVGGTSRRRFLLRSPAFLTVFTFAACSQTAPKSSPQSANLDTSLDTRAKSLPPTPTCDPSAIATLNQTPGPFYSANSPQRQSLIETDTAGSKLIVTGQVLTTDCVPLANSLVDVWQADDKGRYDNTGSKLRGHQFTDAEGRYWLETIVPGLYPGRTRHLHIKVQAPDRPVLTTQLYLPEEPLNERDFLFQPELIMTTQDTADGQQARFDFVLR